MNYFYAVIISFFLLPGIVSQAEKMVSIPPVKRIPVLKNPMIFPRIRTIYNLYRNTNQNFCAIGWLDRPLLHDTSLYQLPPDKRDIENNVRQLDMAAGYGVNGLSMLYHGSLHFHRFEKLIEAAELDPHNNGSKIFISFLGHILRKGPEKAANEFEPVLKRIIASPAAARINGKVVIGSYRTDYISPEQLKQFLKIMRQRCGDKFYFVATIASLRGKKLNNYIHFSRAFEAGNGKLPESEIKAAKEYLRSYLKVCDGLLMNGSNHVDSVNHQFQQKFYSKFICRLFASVLEEPENRGKLLGLSASLGYINHIAGSTQLENGTRNLRETLAAAYAAKPDFIIMPEWNELNENTCLEPSVNRSFSTERIVRYFVQKNKGKLSPLPGDDTGIPNLVVSLRAVLRAGDNFYVELLNVPDSPNSQKYTVTCTLKDEKGKVVKKFAPVSFKSGKLQEHRLALDLQDTASHRAIKPELTITTADGKTIMIDNGLPFTRIQTSWNRNYICLKQPIRDLAKLKHFKVRFIPQKTNRARFEVEAESGRDKLRSVEILEDDTIVYAYDKTGELTPGKNEVLVHFYYDSIKEIRPFPITISVTGGDIVKFRDRLRLGNARENKWKIGRTITMNWKSNRNRRGALMLIKGKDKAELSIKTPIGTEKVKISDLIARGRIIKPLGKTVTIGLATADRALDVPAPINAAQARFTTELRPLNPGAIYRVRLISMSGKTFTSAPCPLPLAKNGNPTQLQVFNSTTLEPVKLIGNTSKYVELFYSPATTRDSIISGNAGRQWDATLGGGLNGFAGKNGYPQNASNPAPAIVDVSGEKYFEFDGIGTYINFPSEVIPAASAFTLEFEFKPFTLKNQALLDCHEAYEGMMSVSLTDKHIQCEFRGRLKPGESPYYKKIKLTSPTPVKLNQWNRVKLVYDLKHIYLSVNDSKPVVAPWSRISWWQFNSANFGGWGKNSNRYFKGQLKYLRIKHYAEQ